MVGSTVREVNSTRAKILDRCGHVSAAGPAGGFLRALMSHGATRYLEQANVDVHALVVDDQLLPIIVNRTGATPTAAISPYSHYYQYTIEEFRKRHAGMFSLPVEMLALPFGAVLRGLSFDQAVFVNHWLFATNPSPSLTCDQFRAITGCLVEAFPNLPIVFRCINPTLDPSVSASLVEVGYSLVRSRRVYLLDGRKKQFLRHKNVDRDLQLLKSSPYEVISCHADLATHASRMAQLYRSVYLDRHSRLNASFTAEFFRLTLMENVLTYKALCKDGTLDAFIGYFLQDNVISAAVLGYDDKKPSALGLYRAILAIAISEANQRNVMLNLGAGAGHFKMLRGAAPAEEFDAVYNRHLPMLRRLPWSALKLSGRFRFRQPPRQR